MEGRVAKMTYSQEGPDTFIGCRRELGCSEMERGGGSSGIAPVLSSVPTVGNS